MSISFYENIIELLQMTSKQLHNYFTLHKRHFELKHKHYCGSLSHLVRYVFLVIVGLGYKFEVFTHSYKLLDNCSYVFSQHSCPMLQRHSIKNAIFRGANFCAYTDPSFPYSTSTLTAKLSFYLKRMEPGKFRVWAFESDTSYILNIVYKSYFLLYI